MNTQQNLNDKDNFIDISGVAHSFDCYLCGGNFNRVVETCMHYEEYEMDEEGEVSLCDICADKAMKKAKEDNVKGLSNNFFNRG